MDYHESTPTAPVRRHKVAHPAASDSGMMSRMTTRPPLSGRLVAILMVVTLCPPAKGAKDARPCRPSAPGERVRVDFDSVPLETVVRFVSCTASLSIIVSPSSLGTHQVTVVAPRPVLADELLDLLRAALRRAHLEMVPRGSYLVIQRRGSRSVEESLEQRPVALKRCPL